MNSCSEYSDIYNLQEGGSDFESEKLGLIQVTQNVMKLNKLLSLGIIITVVGAVISALLPPLVLEQIINLLTSGSTVTIPLAISYFVLLALTSILDSLRESLLVVFGQKITHGLRSTLVKSFPIFRQICS